MRELTDLLNPGGTVKMATTGALVANFGVPPFTVFNAASGPWQDLKRKWLGLGIQSELGRDVAVFAQDALNRVAATKGQVIADQPSVMLRRGGAETDGSVWLKGGLTHRIGTDPYDGGTSKIAASGTSIFDPVLCELFYRWWTPAGGTVLDPFAGGSVRGIVAGCLGYDYTGIDLRAEQVAANEVQSEALAAKIAFGDGAVAACCEGRLYRPPLWLEGDSTLLDQFWADPVDAVFTCPPYFDLEKYSEDTRDISTMSWPQFLDMYARCLANAAAPLRANRFMGIVIGDVRDPQGNYRGLPWQTVAICERLGLKLYNQAILVTAVGSLPIRVSRQFSSGRKLGNTHQHVLVFVKGDGRAAAEACAPLGNGDSGGE